MTEDKSVSAKESQPSDGLVVIGAGLMRTGTLSLRDALDELLGGKCYHMAEVMAKNHAPIWIKAADGKMTEEDWKDLFKDYKAGVDLPVSAFYKELMKVYPNAKVILTTRDPERWHTSTMNTVHAAQSVMTKFPVCCFLSLIGGGETTTMIKKINDPIFSGDFLEKASDKTYAIECFNRHNDEVRRVVPAEKLLDFEVKQGWKPLCQFLGVPEPTKPFPHVNDTKEFQDMIASIRMKAYAVIVGVPLAIGIAGVLGRRSIMRIFKRK